jgi:hypothetical protein
MVGFRHNAVEAEKVQGERLRVEVSIGYLEIVA